MKEIGKAVQIIGTRSKSCCDLIQVQYRDRPKSTTTSSRNKLPSSLLTSPESKKYSADAHQEKVK